MIQSRWTFGKSEFDDIYDIRKKVFISELGLNKEVHFDSYDNRALHVIISEDEIKVAAGRLYEDEGEFYIGAIAVIPEARGKKIGDLLVRVLLNKAFELLADEVYVYARKESIGFYKTLNFTECGRTVRLEENDIREVMKVTKESSPLNHSCGGCEGCGHC